MFATCSICNSSYELIKTMPILCVKCKGILKGGRSLVFSHPEIVGMCADNVTYLSRLIKTDFATLSDISRLSINYLFDNLKFHASLFRIATDTDTFTFNPSHNTIILPDGFIKTVNFNGICSGSCGIIDSGMQDYYKIKDIRTENYYYKNIFSKDEIIRSDYANKISKSFLLDYITKWASITRKLETKTLTFLTSSYIYYPDIYDAREDFTLMHPYCKIMQGIRLMFDATCYHNFNCIAYVTKKHYSFRSYQCSSYGFKTFKTEQDIKFYPKFYIIRNDYIKTIFKNNMFMIKLSIEYLNCVILLCQRVRHYPDNIINLIKIISSVDNDDNNNETKYIAMMYIILENFHVIIQTLHNIYIQNNVSLNISNFNYYNYILNIMSIIPKYFTNIPPLNFYGSTSNTLSIISKLNFTTNPLALLEIIFSSFHLLFFTYNDTSNIIYCDPYVLSDRTSSYYENEKFAHLGLHLKDRHKQPDSCSIM